MDIFHIINNSIGLQSPREVLLFLRKILHILRCLIPKDRKICTSSKLTGRVDTSKTQKLSLQCFMVLLLISIEGHISPNISLRKI